MYTHKQKISFISVIAFLGGAACCYASPASHAFTLAPEFAMDSGDYGSGDTIDTTSFSVTGSYDFAKKWTISVTAVPYMYQNETYTDVVLIDGQPVHHTDQSGVHPHHADTRVSATGVHLPVNHPQDHPSPDIHVPEPTHTKVSQPHPTDIHPPIKPHPVLDNNLPQAAAVPQQNSQVNEQAVRRHGSASGIGDTFINLAYNAVEEEATIPGVSLHTGVKIPTADEDKGLGTGEMDYQLGVSLNKTVGRWFLAGGLDYNILGDPDDYDVDNYFSGYTSVGTEVTPNMDVSLDLTAAQAATDVSDDSLALGIGANYYLEQYGMVTASVATGLTDGSPDYSVLVGYSYSF